MMTEPEQTGLNRAESPLFEPEASRLPRQPVQPRRNVLPQQFTPSMVPQATPTSTALLAASSTQPALHKRKIDEILDMNDDDLFDDGEDLVSPHNPDSEPLPDLPIYHPAVRTVELLSAELIQRFQRFLTDNDYQDAETNYLLDQTKELEHTPHESEVLRIGLIGDAGQGKSSLLNSILGHDNLAIHADDGNSCTFVVLEFAQAPSNQTTPFSATVEFYSRQACDDLIKDQVENYFRNMLKSEDMDEEETHELRLGAGTAVTIFTALFMDHAEFMDKERAEEFLESLESADDPTVLSKLTLWTEHILDELMPDGHSGDIATLSANTASALSEAISPFTMTVPYPSFEGTNLRCCPWPLVKKVRITLRSRVLEQGIIIADLPGTTDKIRSRVEATKRYLQQCDMSIVVNKMGRAIDHAAFYNQIYEAFKRRRSGSIIVVCTRSDDIQVSAKQSFPSTPAEEQALAELAAKTVDINNSIQAVNSALSSPMVRSQSLQRFKTMEKRSVLVRKRQALELKRLEVRVQARNRHVKTGIADQYRQDTKDRSPLPIFCVSNPVYMQHLVGYYKKDPPDLTLATTEIPQLRNAIFSIPSIGRFAALEHYCRSRLPEFLNTVEISCSTSKLKRKEDLNRTFRKSRQGLRATVQDVADKFALIEFDVVFKTAGKSDFKWMNRARRKCDEWAKLPAASHRAVMRHNGDWATKKIKPQNWNKDMLFSVAEDLDPVFESIYNDVSEEFATDIAERVGEAVVKLDNALNIDPRAALSGAILAFRSNLKTRKTQIDKLCERFRKVVKQEIRGIQIRATTDGEGHYFTEAMKPVYEAAMNVTKIRGQTLHQVRCATFQALVTAHGEHSVFLKIGQGIREDFDRMFNTCVDDLINALDGVFDRLQHDVNQVCSTKEDDSPEAKQMRLDLLDLLPDARRLLSEEILRHLEYCKTKRTGPDCI